MHRDRRNKKKYVVGATWIVREPQSLSKAQDGRSLSNQSILQYQQKYQKQYPQQSSKYLLLKYLECVQNREVSILSTAFRVEYLKYFRNCLHTNSPSSRLRPKSTETNEKYSCLPIKAPIKSPEQYWVQNTNSIIYTTATHIDKVSIFNGKVSICVDEIKIKLPVAKILETLIPGIRGQSFPTSRVFLSVSKTRRVCFWMH